MLQRSHSELQGVSTLQGALTQRTTPDRTSRSSRLSKGSMRCCRRPPRGHPLWAWLLLSALVVPGAWSHLSEEQEELLVELHNHYRGQVSPSASAMLPLKWDPTLKVVAEGYAAKCIWNHNPELEETGENLFAGTGPLDLREALEKWFLEHLDFDYQNNSCDEDKMCGHYTQMVWADTHRVGCAVHLCSSMEGLDWETVSFLVCNYYPAGNYEGMKPYVEGDWCSRCPENLQECENNLCVEEDWTSAPPLVRDEPTPVAEVEESEEDVVPPPVITDAPPATTITESIPEDYSNVWIFTDTPPPGTLPPTVGSTTLAEEEEKAGDEMKDVEEEEEEEETMDKPKGEREKVVRKPHLSTEVRISAASVSSPSLLLACLTGILTLSL